MFSRAAPQFVHTVAALRADFLQAMKDTNSERLAPRNVMNYGREGV